MEEKEKVVTNVAATKNKGAYKILREVTNEDLKSWEFTKLEVSKFESKYGITFKWKIPFGFAYLESRQLDVIGYHTILDCKKIDPTGNSTIISAAVRYVKGIGKDSREYHQVQIIIGTRCFLTRLINDNELRLSNSWIKQGKMKPIEWVDVPEKIDEDLDHNAGSNKAILE